MAFTHSLPDAARRHLQAADELERGHRRDVAGYLYGIAAECAVKRMVISLRIPDEHSKNAIHYAHFPDLRTMLRDTFQGRSARGVWAFVTHDAFMNNWSIAMRYADAKQIRGEWVDAWRDQARRVVGAMETDA
jgi:hypothetical protein